MNEIEFQDRVIKEIKLIYPHPYVLNTNLKNTIGVPDLLICIDGKFIAIELKVCRKERCTIQNMFPRSRKQIPTLYDIEVAGGKGYGLILFVIPKKVMLFRINFHKFDFPTYHRIINQMNLSPYNDMYPELLICNIDQLFNLNKVLENIK